MGMPVGSGMLESFTHLETGLGSAPPNMPIVAPLATGWRSPQAWLVAVFFPSPPAAKRKSRPPLVPGETLASRPPRSAWPSVPSTVEAQDPSG